jgi:protein arginine N-methyltransferase 5
MKYGNFKQTSTKGERSNDDVEMKSGDDLPIVIMYFGAGRGPLIRRALHAAKTAKANVHVVALDKNPNAIVTLRNMIIDEGMEDKVTLIAGDMRHISVDKLQGDILMSELLGSFGDNELSPECLIPTAKYLKPGGIFIPWSYTNHVLPLSS